MVKQERHCYSLTCKKDEVWKIIKRHRPVHPECHVDAIAKKAGHTVIHLPVAHGELNLTEMMWAQMKRYLKTHNVKFTLKELEKLTHEAFTEITPQW